MFRILERFNIALSHAHRRNLASRLKPWRMALPQAFPQYNGGVILYRRSPGVLAFLEEWRQSFHTAGYLQDQMTLRELLWLSNLRMATLPPDYITCASSSTTISGRRPKPRRASFIAAAITMVRTGTVQRRLRKLTQRLVSGGRRAG